MRWVVLNINSDYGKTDIRTMRTAIQLFNKNRGINNNLNVQ